jgi:hypothetical protein
MMTEREGKSIIPFPNIRYNSILDRCPFGGYGWERWNEPVNAIAARFA